MNKYQVTIKVYAYTTGYIPPSTLTFAMSGLQYNMATTTFSTKAGTSVAVFDYVVVPLLQSTDAVLFTVSDTSGTSMQSLNVSVIASAGAFFNIGNYLFQATSVTYAGLFTVSASYDVKFVFSAFNSFFATPKFYVTLTDASGKGYTGYNYQFSVKTYDLQLQGLSYTAAVLKSQATAQPIGSCTFVTDYTSKPSTDSPQQPMQLFATIIYNGTTYTPSNSATINLETQTIGINSPTNVPYQTYTMLGGGGGSTMQYSLLISNNSFTSTLIPTPTPTPTPTPVVETTSIDTSSLDDRVGISEESLFMNLENDESMTPSTRAAARKRLYEEALVKSYDKKSHETIEEERKLSVAGKINDFIVGKNEQDEEVKKQWFGYSEEETQQIKDQLAAEVLKQQLLYITPEGNQQIKNNLAAAVLDKQKQYNKQQQNNHSVDQVNQLENDLDEMERLKTWYGQPGATAGELLNLVSSERIKQDQISSLEQRRKPHNQQQPVDDTEQLAADAEAEDTQNIIPSTDEPVDTGKYSPYQIGVAAAAGITAAGALYSLLGRGKETQPIVPIDDDNIEIGNDLEEINRTIGGEQYANDLHQLKIQQQKANQDFEHYSEAKIRGITSTKRKKLFNANQL